MSEHHADFDTAIATMLARIDGPLRIATPLGLGKPHRLLNALYERIAADPSRELHIYTALSLDPPRARGDGLDARFLGPFAERMYGRDFPRLKYVAAEKKNALPAHIEVEEFYMQSGALMNSSQAQRRYASLNYTHVARALADRGVNCIVQKVASSPDDPRLSLSCNTDLTLDTLRALDAAGRPRPLLVAEIDPHLPWLGNHAALDEAFFDLVIAPPAPHPPLFALPRQPVGDVDYAIGLYASTLVKDGGTLQIGIGALADALSHALVLRHTDNARYREVLRALDPEIERHPLVARWGGLDPFEQGLYGCSEMLNEGFRLLARRGILKRKVVDDLDLMRRLDAGNARVDDHERLAREGQFLRGAFYLGSPDFYQWLRDLDPDAARAIDMLPVSRINALPRDNETLERLQRRHSRHFNTCMMATALGAAVSDMLEDGRVVSGVGGQYNFVTMAQEMDDARSVLMLRASRENGNETRPNILWNYGHATIPRHLRDIYISEYGIADVLGRVDEDVIEAMAGIADAAHQPALIEQAKQNGKLARDFSPPSYWARNTRPRLLEALAPFRRDGTLPDYPLGSDFTDTEQRLAKALARLKADTATRQGKWRAMAAALLAAGDWHDPEAMARMDMTHPQGFKQKLEARMLDTALRATRPHS
ncbi:acetyl-CoA hydrolase [Lysobacter pythonis]|uniref:Acetyl-CoA hydrolase n=1 Tax=Solilutibacter pythonis TaxID=2483112 RepID=A0A3M2HUL4_9GAMM|nr:acetyl-CoA hydrolase/transferase C-terminal domain-containing protein [Lysobacter pythonis]RMH93426.1 acetyl-CoA hydrolase [Lysobacter pythonis]